MILNRKILYILTGLSLFFINETTGQVAPNSTKRDFISTLQQPSQWVDSVFKRLSRKQRIAQLFMIPVYSNYSKEKQDSIVSLIQKYQTGGIITFQGGPVRQALLLNRIQSKLKVPALVAIDGEWGLGMRLDSTVSYPFQMTLGAIQNNDLLYKVGSQMAAQFKRAGIHMNFAPVVDVNNNINNPVINFRSFGENKIKVAEKGIAIMKGMQDGGLLATAKHFPGHGDTDVDSHHDLPMLNFSRTRLDTLEMYPFKQIVNTGIGGVMVAHMNIPALDSTKNLPSTLSKPIVSSLLKDTLQFKGLVFTDAMNMKGVVKFHPKGEAAVLAMAAGNDMLEMVENLPQSIKAVRKAIRNKTIDRKTVNERCKKILAAKYWIGLNKYQPVYLPNLTEDLNPDEATDLNTQLADAAVTTLIQPADSVIKYGDKPLVISFGTSETSLFQNNISAETNAVTLHIDKDADSLVIESARKQIAQYNKIIIGIHDRRARPRSVLDYNSGVIDFISELARSNKAYIAVMANAYTMAKIKDLEKCRGLWVLYEDSKFTELAAAQTLLGELHPTGKLPVTVNDFFRVEMGL